MAKAPSNTSAPRVLPAGVHRRGWYAHVVDWLAAAPDVRHAVGYATQKHYDSIARLEPEWGRMLDDLDATYRQIRWVASAGIGALSQRQARYRALVAFLREGRKGERAFAALRAQCVAVGRAAKRAEREARGDGDGGGASASQKGTPST
jgi:hypothetical protein